MCTVSFIPRKSGYILGMNRDEQRSRAKAVPPVIKDAGGCLALYPSEPTGGTWIGVNERRITLALVNWYSIPKSASGKALSRGDIIPRLLGSTDLVDARKTLKSIDLRSTNPFRLIGIFPDERTVMEWQWDLQKLNSLKHEWRAKSWISSGFDEPGAQKKRGAEFRRMSGHKSFGSIGWLRRFHASHHPERGPFSVCMHREDAATVSYTEIILTGRRVRMNYQPEAPCHAKTLSKHSFSIR
jgi:hypothetical protein